MSLAFFSGQDREVRNAMATSTRPTLKRLRGTSWLAGLLVGSLMLGCTSAAPTSASGQPGGSGAVGATQCATPLKQVTMFVGGSPGIAEVVIPEPLGYYASEACVHVNFQVAATSLALITALTSGQAQYSGVHPSATLTAQAQQAGELGIISACGETHKTTWSIAVRPDSAIASVKDMRGKKIGVPNFANSEAFGIQSALAAEGIDPVKDASIIQVSTGAAMGNALQTSQVDVIVAGDVEIANAQDLGFQFKLLPDPDSWKALSAGYGISVTRDYYNKNKDEIAGVCRAMAMGQVFGLTNPDATAKLFWKMLPETKGAGDAAALHRATLIIQTRQRAWTTCGPVIHCAGYQWGDQPVAGWQAYAKYLNVADKIPNINGLFTNEFLPKINSFDVDAVAKFAQSYTYKE